MSTGLLQRLAFAAILSAVPAFDVLPAALVHAAAGVRAFAREVGMTGPVRLSSGSDVLDAAVAELAGEWGRTARSLEERAFSAAQLLQDCAEHYGDVDGLLVPRALR